MEYIHMFIAILVFFFNLFWWIFRAKDGYPTNWLFIGMLPAIYKNVNRIHDYIIEIIEKSENMSFNVKGPWFFNMKFLVTVDPVNINYVYSRNFKNYGKGPNLHEVLDFMGDGIFAIEADELWEYHRKITHSFFSHPKFQSILFHTIWNETENSLIPLLDHASKNAIQIDLQDIFTRFTVDNICTLLMNHNPKFLSLEFPSMSFCKAIKDLEKMAVMLHLLPQRIWKSLRWFGVGAKKYKKDVQTVDDFIYMLIAKKREESKNRKQSKSTLNSISTKDNIDKLSYYDLMMVDIDDDEIGANKKSDKFIKDTMLSLIMAGTSTTSVVFPWLFYLLSKNPHVSTKIRDELNSVRVQQNKGTTIDEFLKNFSQYKNNLVYLHVVICETLRLYPSVPFNLRAAIKPDILPSGHQLNPNMFIIFDLYAMGRMKSIWGDDCVEFKPERWIKKQGNIKFEPTHKFVSFGTGPRTCQGKEMAFTQLKFLIAALIMKYDVEVVKQNEVAGELSAILHMKHGLNVKIKTRE